jgi:hypothetical protein
MMLRLRPLVVLTGTPHVEGGVTSKRRKPAAARNKKTAVITEDLEITPDRKRANVIAVDYSRRLRKMAILRTPLGLLIDPSKLPVLLELSSRLTRDAIAFNRTSTTTEITNCWLIETLVGQRRAAIEGWVARRLAKGDKKVLAARAALEAGVGAGNPAPPVPAAPPEPAAEPEPVEPEPDGVDHTV